MYESEINLQKIPEINLKITSGEYFGPLDSMCYKLKLLSRVAVNFYVCSPGNFFFSLRGFEVDAKKKHNEHRPP